MPRYEVNEAAFKHATQLIEKRRYILRSDWGERQPTAADHNRYLRSHGWDEYGEWHLGLTDGAADDTKGRYAFVFGDFRRIHRSGIIACYYRAAEWEHTDIQVAAHKLLLHLDRSRRSR